MFEGIKAILAAFDSGVLTENGLAWAFNDYAGRQPNIAASLAVGQSFQDIPFPKES